MNSHTEQQNLASQRRRSLSNSSSSNTEMNAASTQLLANDGAYEPVRSPAFAGGSANPSSLPYNTPGHAYQDSPTTDYHPSDPESKSGAYAASGEIKRRPVQAPLDPALHGMRRASIAVRQTPKKRFRHQYEPVNWADVIILLVAVAISWSIGQFTPKPWIQGYNLTVARIVVGIIGIVIGVLCGYALFVRIGTRIYAAVVFATLVHTEMPLRTIDDCANPAPFDALRLLEYRLRSQETRKSRRPYDQRRWSIWIVYFLFVFLVSNVCAFAYGRTVIIYTVAQPQFDTFHEVPVLGEISPDDLVYATNLIETFQSMTSTWTLASVSSLVVPSTASLPLVDEASGLNATVYFTEASSSLFSPTAVGPAASLWRAFIKQTLSSAITTDVGVTDDALSSVAAQGADATRTGAKVPVAVEYPAWGSRVQCETFAESGATVVVSTSGATELAVQQSSVQRLVEKVGADQSLISYSSALNVTGGMLQVGTAPNDGIASSTFTQILDGGNRGGGYVILDTVLVRLTTAQAPEGHFFYTSNSLGGAPVGLDGAVCITRISPYIVRAVDNSGTVGLTAIVGEGASISEFPRGSSTDPPLFTVPTQDLTSTSKQTVMNNALDNSRNQMLKDNGRANPYVANPTLVQMTNVGTTVQVPSLAYGNISSLAVAKVLAGADTRFMLPYLVGQGRVPGRAYTFNQKAYAYVKTEWLALLMGVILLTGLIGAFFVPSPPFNLPFRTLKVSNWLSFAEQVPRATAMSDEFEDLRPVKIRYGR